MSVVGARPQFVKLSPIDRQFRESGIEHVIVHTGQHYDPMLSQVFFDGLGISAPDVHLAVGSGSHGHQTGAILSGMDRVLEDYTPDWVLVYGDTNSTVAGALSAVKMHFPVAHLEAGLRSFNRRMPEEHNRVLTDHAADLLLAPTVTAMSHLAREGLSNRSVLVGDVMVDVLHRARDEARALGLVALSGSEPGSYYAATIHRAENTDNPARLRAIVAALQALDKPVMLFAHPRFLSKASALDLDLERGSLKIHEPLSYSELIGAVLGSAGVITDSGGLQKEAFLLRVPCTTLRTETEWSETVDLGWNQLVQDLDTLAAVVQRPAPVDTDATPYGEGAAAAQVVSALRSA
ncbi:UDP-N-acetylglucosamine 2-epimerase (non-hydrolysing) [Agrococcus baldri]|uniref:UDP-N-acetylglucosamine 2-epimerase (Non-hydrolysing) n=2 Tax=Agrococcus baldri TaxID=153730 RepID=A0AA94HKJ6_9MICO|nr:UDP-N-acetylglucosamine 2-epimerase (non-hydrolysing) [Agrococcus baldri]